MEIFKPTELNFSDKAIEHFTSSLAKRGNGLGIQIGVRKAGCSGSVSYTHLTLPTILLV